MKKPKKVIGIDSNEIRQCGIAGAGGGESSQNAIEVSRMALKIDHRGPDKKTFVISKDGK